MATHFQIKKGPYKNLFDANGVCILPEHKLIEGCWYLTTDTAEIFVCLKDESNNTLVLRKLNETKYAPASGCGLLQVGSREDLYISERDPNTIYIVEDENATYKWFPTINDFVCIGRNYEEITVICGGGAASNADM